MRELSMSDLADAVEQSCAVPRPASSRAVAAILAALEDALPPPARGHLLRVVEGSAWRPGRAGSGGARTLADVVNHVVAATGATPSAALEEIIVVCSAIAAAWTEEDRRVVAGDLEPDLRQLFEDRPPAEAVPHRIPGVEAQTGEQGAGERDERRTLSTGRPGSRHPLATSAAADPDSARAANPHGRDKLSSGAPRLERGGNTLSSGRPRGSTHPTD